MSGKPSIRSLAFGLYEALVTHDHALALREADELLAQTEELGSDGTAHVFARHIHDLVVRALRSLPGNEAERLVAQLELANAVIAMLGATASSAGIDDGDAVASPASLLLSLAEKGAERLGTSTTIRPELPLRQSDLLVNGPRDLRLGNELRRELASADRVDLLLSFLKWSGLRVVRSELSRFCREHPGQLRVLTTTYLGATDVEALEALAEMGARVKVSYDARRTRLHAKAWLFHRDSGFSTAFVGSSNLSHSALLDGCEWNVRLSNVDNRAILAKFQATFDQYWDENDFEDFDRERFLEATKRRDVQRDALARALQLRPYPYQQEVLDALELERLHGHTRNLVVAATGTGKTVVAALDYARLRQSWGEASLLFVAHRREILEQSRATFRAAVREGDFGELLVGGDKPTRGSHVFASIQSLHANRLAALEPDAYDVVVVDEFHHAAAPTYEALLERVRPKVLLGLTATPERADGKSVLHWFDDRVASELRLWDALDLGLLVPFQYFGVFDGTDLSMLDWRSGRYDVDSLEQLYTADHARAKAVTVAVAERVRSPQEMRALGFCVSVKHARFMAEYFRMAGLAAEAVTGETPKSERQEALRKLERGELPVIFTVDLFNEGVDLPAVDTVLFLRPTESATVFVQQLGRGLRLADGKECLTVLDFIGRARREFRFDLRFRALVGGSRSALRRVVENGFPRLPAGCEIQLDQESQEVVLENLKTAIAHGTKSLVEELQRLGDVSLGQFLAETEIEAEELYKANRCFTTMKQAAGLRGGEPVDKTLSNALRRALHIDDDLRLDAWRQWLRAPTPPTGDVTDPLQLMLFASLGQVRRPVDELGEALAELWAHPDLRAEWLELLDVLADRQRRPTFPLSEGPLSEDPRSDSPFRVHATYSRDEISAGLLETRKGKLLRTQGGVLKLERHRCDVLYVTLEKDEKEFTPTTLYDDYPLSPTRFHWESQSTTREDSPTGRRYQEHAERDWRILLFVREKKRTATGVTMPYVFLGPVRYVEHEGEKPMRIIWELERAMPPGFFRGVKVAAG